MISNIRIPLILVLMLMLASSSIVNTARYDRDGKAGLEVQKRHLPEVEPTKGAGSAPRADTNPKIPEESSLIAKDDFAPTESIHLETVDEGSAYFVDTKIEAARQEGFFAGHDQGMSKGIVIGAAQGMKDGIRAVVNDPATYNLFSESSILDLNLGGLILERGESGFELQFSLEISEDLITWETTELFRRVLQPEGDQTFLRVRTGPSLTDPAPPIPDIQIYEHTALGPILTDAEGRVLYRFEFDLPGGSPVEIASWPIAEVPVQPLAADGVTAMLGTGEGSYLTLNQYPIYYYIHDQEPGEASGHAAGFVWWTISPDGSLNTVSDPPPSDPNSPPSDPTDPPPLFDPGDPPPRPPGDS